MPSFDFVCLPCQMAVEKVQGISRLEQLCEELSEEERARELKQEKKRQKRKNRRKNKCGFDITEPDTDCKDKSHDKVQVLIDMAIFAVYYFGHLFEWYYW